MPDIDTTTLLIQLCEQFAFCQVVKPDCGFTSGYLAHLYNDTFQLGRFRFTTGAVVDVTLDDAANIWVITIE